MGGFLHIEPVTCWFYAWTQAHKQLFWQFQWYHAYTNNSIWCRALLLLKTQRVLLAALTEKPFCTQFVLQASACHLSSIAVFRKWCMQPRNIYKLNVLSHHLFSQTWPYSDMIMSRKVTRMLRLLPCVVIFLKAFKLDGCFYKYYFNAVYFLQCKSIKALGLLQKLLLMQSKTHYTTLLSKTLPGICVSTLTNSDCI